MNKNLVIHIGIPKVLSIFLQTYVFRHLEDTYFEGSHRDEENLLTTTVSNIISLKNPLNYDTEKLRKDVSSLINSIEEQNILISEEMFFGLFFNNFKDKKANIDLIKEIFPLAKIFIILRRQDKFVESLYKHMLKLGYSVRFKNFLNYKNDKFI